jgi:hypothetical protein
VAQERVDAVAIVFKKLTPAWITPMKNQMNGIWEPIKARAGSLPTDLESLAWQVTTLDQRSWLSAMGDPRPVADSSPAQRDLSAHPTDPLATLIGMPPKSLWPPGIDSFHEVSLDGYFACWIDAQRKVSVVIYAVTADYAEQTEEHRNHSLITEELLRLMKSAKLEAVH